MRIDWASFEDTKDAVVMVCGPDIDDPDQDVVLTLYPFQRKEVN